MGFVAAGVLALGALGARAALQGGDDGTPARTATAATDAAEALAAPLEDTDGGVDPDAGSDTTAPSAPEEEPEDPAAALPDAPEPAFTIPTPTPLAADETAAIWAPVRQAVAARSQPSANSPTVARIEERTPEGTRNVVQVLERVSRGARVWVRVRVAALPNGQTGWVPRVTLGGYGTVHTHLVVDRERLRATLERDGEPIFEAPVAIGTDAAPTPAGQFYVRVVLSRYASPFYGPVAFGTSARSAVLTDWPAGGFVGIHGTDRPDLVPGRVSHGCIRLRNADIVRLARLMPVGTPVTIR